MNNFQQGNFQQENFKGGQKYDLATCGGFIGRGKGESGREGEKMMTCLIV